MTAAVPPDAPRPAAPRATVHRPLAAALWMAGSIGAFASIAVAGREAAAGHDTFEILLWRSILGFAIVAAVSGAAGRLGEVQTRRLPLHLLRNLCHFGGQSLWFWALASVPLAQVFALEFTTPVWVILASALFLGERLTAGRIGAAVLGFAGVLTVVRPDFAALSPGVLAAAGSALFFASNTVLTKGLTRAESTVSILFWLTLMQAFIGLAAAGADLEIALPTAATLPALVVVGVGGLAAHWCLVSALSLAPAGFVVTVDFLRLPVIAAVGWAVYGERADIWLGVGAVLILAGIVVNLRWGPERNTRPSSARRRRVRR